MLERVLCFVFDYYYLKGSVIWGLVFGFGILEFICEGVRDFSLIGRKKGWREGEIDVV